MIHSDQQKTIPADHAAVFLKDLRRVTHPAHETLEQNPYTSVLMKPEVSRQDYITYLKRMYGFVHPAETAVYSTMSASITDAGQRVKAGCILADLCALGVPENEIQALPTADLTGIYTTAAQKAALMYVLEGSSLGGNVIFRHLHKTLGIEPHNGGTYLSFYGAATGPMWQHFISEFSALATTQGWEQETIQAAADTFSRIDNWLSHQH